MNIRKSALSLAVISSLLLTACGGSSDSAPEVDVEVNTAPTDIVLNNLVVSENSLAAALGDLSTVDADTGDSFTYSITDDRFVISGNSLSLADDVTLDFEVDEEIDLEITVTDSDSNSFSKILTIVVSDVLDTYAFDSKIIAGDINVSYTGQVARHALIAELNHYISNQLQEDLDPQNGVLTSRQQVLDKLNSYYRTTDVQYDGIEINFIDNPVQQFIANISSSPKNLNDKIAGNDNSAMDQHQDWNNGDFVGWGAEGSTTPEGLVDILFGQLADNAEQELIGNVRQSVTGEAINEIYINADGTDLKQLIQKFLLMAVAYSQGTDDYLDDANAGKGLLTENLQDGTKAYSSLEHQFDEGFGYFGASREYLSYSDNELSGDAGENDRADWNNNHDTDADGKFDLTAEVNFGNSVNAAKRDRGTVGNANPTDFTTDIMEAFIAGRKIINDNAGVELTTEQFDALIEQRDIIVDVWERSIASTIIHYINDTHADLANLGTDDFDFEDTAKHFSELKGFALGLQFNPHSKISLVDFAEIHRLIDDKPVLDSATVAAYQADLMTARGIIATALSFDADNVTNW